MVHENDSLVFPGETDNPDNVFQRRVKRFLQQDRIGEILQLPEIFIVHEIRRRDQNAVRLRLFQQFGNGAEAGNLELIPFAALLILQIIGFHHARD